MQNMKIIYKNVDALVPYANNPRTHSPAQIAQIASSIKEFGWTNPVLLDGDNGVIAGHGRLEASRILGIESVPTIELKHLTEAQKKAYIIADNQLAQNAGWDDDLLGIEIGALQDIGFDISLLGFDDKDIARLTFSSGDGLTDPDEVPDVEESICKTGDIWLLGEHRLLCGDATKKEDVDMLMDGVIGHMVFTDPPYGVAYDGGAKKRDRLEGDEVGTDIYAASLINLKRMVDDSAALYLWYADGHAAAAAAAAAAAGYVITAQIIWAKNHAQFVTSAHYKGKHEPCYYGHRKGKSARWLGPNNEVTLWEYDRSSVNEFHPTQKPVPIACRAITNSTELGHIVLDLFLGSGTTMVAAEQLGRICYGMEIEPHYCDVIINRWQNFTGKKAIKGGVMVGV